MFSFRESGAWRKGEKSNAPDNLRCKAVVDGNVRVSSWTTLGRGSVTALASLCVSNKAISQPPSRHEERLSHILDSCLAVKRQTRNLEKETWEQEELKE